MMDETHLSVIEKIRALGGEVILDERHSDKPVIEVKLSDSSISVTHHDQSGC